MKIQPKFIAIAISLSSLFTPVHAQEKAWTLGSRTLPAPAAASDALRESIADTSQPDVAEHIRTTTFTINEEWVQTIQALNTFSMQRGEALPERRSVTIKKAEIAGVTVHTVTPTDINPANSNRLFVHLHGGAYVLNAGRAGLSEAIIIAHWVKIPVVSIDYRMPPEHPFPAAIVDVVAVWRSLLDDRPAKSMALGGTSAGGGLTLASTLRFVENLTPHLRRVGTLTSMANSRHTRKDGQGGVQPLRLKAP